MSARNDIFAALADIADPHRAAEYLAPRMTQVRQARAGEVNNPQEVTADGRMVAGPGRGHPRSRVASGTTGRSYQIAPQPKPPQRANAQQAKPRQQVPHGYTLDRTIAETSRFGAGPPMSQGGAEGIGRGAMAGWEWFNRVRPGGRWDFKSLDKKTGGHPEYEDFGNLNYGATGRQLGIPASVLRRAAGFVQQYGGARDPKFGHWYGGYPYGDDPVDQALIDQGIRYQEQRARRR